MSRENPSRAAEAAAIEVVQRWIGSAGEVSGSGDFLEDFRIRYGDGRRGSGEVKVDFNEDKQRQWSALLDLPRHQTVDLPAGAGGWLASVTPAASIRELRRVLPALIAGLVAESVTEHEVRFAGLETELSEQLSTLGIEHISLVQPGADDRCLLFTQSYAGMVPTDADSAVAWIRGCFDDTRFANSWDRLAASDADEKHAYIWIESGAPEDLRLRISFHPEIPPTTTASVPAWLTHLWIGIPVSFASRHWTWLFRPEVGWLAIPES